MEMHRRRSTYKGDRGQIISHPDPIVCALIREHAALLKVSVAQYAADVLCEHLGMDHLILELHGLDLGILPPSRPDPARASYADALNAPAFVKTYVPRDAYNVVKSRAAMLGTTMGTYLGDVLCDYLGLPELMTDLRRGEFGDELDLDLNTPAPTKELPLAI